MFNKKYFVTFLILLTFYTFFNLFSDVKVEFLSRERTQKEKKEIIEDLKNGNISIIIGTHSLLSDSISFSDVKVEFLSLSLVEYKEFSLNCGSVYQILFEGVEYTDKNLRMNEVVCYNNAVLKILNAFVSIIFILVLFRFGIKYINKKSNTEDLSDLLLILRRRNKRDI